VNITYARRAVYRFALRPRWLIRHVIVLVVVGLFALAGFWQIHRLHERRARNTLITSRRRAPETTLDDALRASSTAEHRHIRAAGRYDTAREVVLLGRADGDLDGNHILTPMITSGGRAVVVDRGWVPSGLESPPVASAAPPGGNVVVHGELLASEHSPFGGATGKTKIVSLIDVHRLAQQLPYPVAPLYVLLASQAPPQRAQLPVVVKPLPLGNGPHFSYAVQWFSFLVIALVGYGVFLRRESRRGVGQPVGDG
jgi:cytochrome oxidase assembly protein ShyY1